MRSRLFVLALAFALGACSGLSNLVPQDQAQTMVDISGAYKTFAAAEVSYAQSGKADADVAGVLMKVDDGLHDAVVKADQAAAAGNSAALAAALSAARSGLDEAQPAIDRSGSSALQAAATALSGAIDALAATPPPATPAPTPSQGAK